MFSGRNSKTFRSFAFYLCLGYLVVYALCTVSVYVLTSRVITQSARGFDRQDVTAESEELVDLIQQNTDGNLLAEQVTMERYPPAIIFIVRVICCVLFTLRMRARILCRFVKGRQLLSAGGGNGGS